jgi:hypothetical protein
MRPATLQSHSNIGTRYADSPLSGWRIMYTSMGPGFRVQEIRLGSIFQSFGLRFTVCTVYNLVDAAPTRRCPEPLTTRLLVSPNSTPLRAAAPADCLLTVYSCIAAAASPTRCPSIRPLTAAPAAAVPAVLTSSAFTPSVLPADAAAAVPDKLTVAAAFVLLTHIPPEAAAPGAGASCRRFCQPTPLYRRRDAQTDPEFPKHPNQLPLSPLDHLNLNNSPMRPATKTPKLSLTGAGVYVTGCARYAAANPLPSD